LYIYVYAHRPSPHPAISTALSSVFGVPLSEGLDAHLRSENTELFRPTGVDAPPASRGPAVSSSKGALGHMLGAAGAIEAALAVMAVHTDRAVPTVGGPIAKEFENLNILATNAPGIIPEDGQPAPTPASVPGASSGAIDVAMTNSFGFGGSNASLLFRKHQ
jgi:3-oxoacyl-[acyl-carrier-protein] synthase II